MAEVPNRRLSPEARKAAILAAATNLLDREGVRGFSLEAVAREARVAASLPRHYFGSTVKLLGAATFEVLKEVELELRSPPDSTALIDRFAGYLEVICRHPWGHAVWMRAAEIDPTMETMVRQARSRMGEVVFRRPWKSLTRKEQIQARGWIGFVEAVVSDWIDRGFSDRQLVLEVLMQGVQGFRPGPPPAGIKTSPQKPSPRKGR